MSHEQYRVELTGPHDAVDGACMMCRVEVDADGWPKRNHRKVYDLSLVLGHVSDTWRLCREHIKEVRSALRGTIS